MDGRYFLEIPNGYLMNTRTEIITQIRNDLISIAEVNLSLRDEQTAVHVSTKGEKLFRCLFNYGLSASCIKQC